MSEVGQRIWQNRLDAKIADYENAVKEHGEASEEVISALRNLAFYLPEAGEYTRAAALAEEACASFLAATLGDESEMSILCRRLASAAYARSETPGKALSHLEATLAYTLVRNGEDDPTVSRLREKIAEIKG